MPKNYSKSAKASVRKTVRRGGGTNLSKRKAPRTVASTKQWKR